jgi:hypothetical protein
MDSAVFFRMPLFKPGAVVWLGGRQETVSHILIRRSVLMVHLVGHGAPVNADVLTVEPTVFTLSRTSR